MIRQGNADEEVRLCTGDVAGTGNTHILSVAEAWEVQPASSDSFFTAYSSDDMVAFNGMTLNTKTGVYEGGGSREWQIGLGTDFAWVAVFNYQGWEITDRGTSEPGLTCRNNGRLDFGYIQGGKPISGGIVSSTNTGPDEPQIEIESGGILRSYATLYRAWLLPEH